MKNYLLMLFSAVFLFTACSSDDDKETVKNDKEAILLVTFGSSYPEPQKTFARMEDQFKEKFSDADIKWAYTADYIINKLRKRLETGEEGGLDIDTPIEALNKFKKEGYKKITVQSLHVIPGKEFTDLTTIIKDFDTSNPEIAISLGKPLMYANADMEELASSLVNNFNKENLAGEAMIFMGHGTHHEANDRYSRFQTIISKKAPLFFIGVVEDGAEPSFDSVLKILKEKNIKNVTLTPLMSIAGDHANNDMADINDKDSWASRLQKEGITSKSILKGLGDYENITKIWANHLEIVKNK